MSILTAIYNLVNNPIVELVEYYHGRNRANNMGDALEEYVKDLFANSFEMPEHKRILRLSNVFSYLGNTSNPPDAMLRGGDAIEVKKIESPTSGLALNSSYPKHTLKRSSTMISTACRNAENWTEKDMIYVVGVVNRNNLKHLSMVYGSDYCASDSCYKRIKNILKHGVESIPGVEFAETKELGRVNKVDPLGITYLRVRGMWGIDNPWSVFNYVYQRDLTNKFTFMCIINDTKWASFDMDEKELIMTIDDPRFCIKNIRIKDPDNPAKLNSAKLITFYLN